jgi:hypothetical protein
MIDTFSDALRTLHEYDLFARLAWSVGMLYGSMLLALLLTPYLSFLRLLHCRKQQVDLWIIPVALGLCLAGHISGGTSAIVIILQLLVFVLLSVLYFTIRFIPQYNGLIAGLPGIAVPASKSYRLLARSFVRRNGFDLIARFQIELWLLSLFIELCMDDHLGIGAGIRLTFRNWDTGHAVTVIGFVSIVITLIAYILYKSAAIASPWRYENEK